MRPGRWRGRVSQARLPPLADARSALVALVALRALPWPAAVQQRWLLRWLALQELAMRPVAPAAAASGR
jgi:hypothetical protein